MLPCRAADQKSLGRWLGSFCYLIKKYYTMKGRLLPTKPHDDIIKLSKKMGVYNSNQKTKNFNKDHTIL